MNDPDGVEVDIKITRIDCHRCKLSRAVQTTEEGEAFLAQHPGHAMKYVGTIVDPPELAGREVVVDIVAPGGPVH